MIPTSKPRAPRHVVQSAALAGWIKHIFKDPANSEQFPEFYVLGVRGYYRDTMGKAGVNDRGIYDDAMFVVGPETFVAFNANTDPSMFRKGVASLIPGWYPFRPGNHGISRPGGGYPAFRPATKGEALPVIRDGEDGRSKRDGVAINIHKGGYNTTSSEGCQTIYPPEWPAFHALVHMELKRAGLKRFWYGLLDGPIA
jgi:lysozyme